jgi:hypothetical protein
MNIIKGITTIATIELIIISSSLTLFSFINIEKVSPMIGFNIQNTTRKFMIEFANNAPCDI